MYLEFNWISINIIRHGVWYVFLHHTQKLPVCLCTNDNIAIMLQYVFVIICTNCVNGIYQYPWSMIESVVDLHLIRPNAFVSHGHTSHVVQVKTCISYTPPIAMHALMIIGWRNYVYWFLRNKSSLRRIVLVIFI